MAGITQSHDSVLHITLFKVEGEAAFDAIWAQTHNYFSNTPSRLVLWDFTSGSLGSVSSQEVRRLAVHGSAISDKIDNGKAAIVAPNDTEYGVSRAFQAFSDIKDFPLQIRVFRDMPTARKWLIE